MHDVTRKTFLTGAAAGSMLCLAGCGAGGGAQGSAGAAKPLKQTIVVEGFDWGPNVTKTVVDFEADVDPACLSADLFTVSDKRQDYVDDPDAPDGVDVVEHDRTVTDVYPSDEHGARLDGPSPYVTIEMQVGNGDGNCQIWIDSKSMNFWSDPYELRVALADGKAIELADGTKLDEIVVSTEGLIDTMYCPVMDSYATGTFEASDGRTLTYAEFAPAQDDAKHPLVVWLHGAGGGGTDPRMAIFDTKCTALVEDGFQDALGGAHVLIPQCDGFWLEWADMGDKAPLDNPGEPSVWKPAVLELIDTYLEEHPDVDPGRVLVGGCSNGGYLTLDLAFERPDFFAAAFPISEAYMDSGITDDMLASIKDLPMWFVYTHADSVVDPAIYEDPTLKRLEDMGASQLHTSIYDKAVITEGPFKGMEFEAGHEAWIYFFNGQCVDEQDVDMWTWLGEVAR